MPQRFPYCLQKDPMNPSVQSVLLLPGAFQPIHYRPGYSAQPAKHGRRVITHRRDNTDDCFHGSVLLH